MRSAVLTGLALTYALPLINLLTRVVTTAAETEQEMVAVERTMHFSAKAAVSGTTSGRTGTGEEAEGAAAPLCASRAGRNLDSGRRALIVCITVGGGTASPRTRPRTVHGCARCS